MNLSNKTTAIGSSSLLGIVATLLISLLDEPEVAKVCSGLISFSPKITLILLSIILIVCYYSLYRFISLKRESKIQSQRIEEYDNRLIENKKSIDRDYKQKLLNQRDLFNQEIAKKNEELRDFNAKSREIQRNLEHQVGELKRENELVCEKLAEKDSRINQFVVDISSKEKEIKKCQKGIQDLKSKLKEKENEIESLKKQCNVTANVNSGRIWEHNVLIIDDDEDVVTNLRRKLQGIGIHVDTALEIPDYRFASDYEIIISDVFQCAPAEESTSILNTIKEKYPYKFVYAMSVQPAACQGLEIDGRIIQKDEQFHYVNEIKQLVQDSRKKLDRIHEHWKNTEKNLLNRNVSEELIKNIESFYYNFVKRMQTYQ